MAVHSKSGKSYVPGRKDEPRAPRLDTLAARYEVPIVLTLCAIAAVRVFLFSAAFPLFNNVDEHRHADAVYQYAHGTIPTDLFYSEDVVEVITLYCSPMYNLSVDQQAPPPVWSTPPDERVKIRAYVAEMFRGETETEATQPPVYYALAAAWYKVGALVGLKGGLLFYWVRFINAWLYPLLIWCAFVGIRKLYPERRTLAVGVPLLLAFFPQDVFYSITNDALSPLAFGVAMYLLIQIYRELPGSYWLCLTAGLAVAAAVLVKFSNAAIVGVLAIVLVAALLRLREAGRLRAGLPRLAVLCSACFVPIAAWLLRNFIALDDPTGNDAKIRVLGWTLKPLDAIFDHPIFTIGGACQYTQDLISRFWRGEIIWRTESMRVPVADAVYVITTLLFLTASLLAIWKRRKGDAGERFENMLGLAALAMSTAMLVWISIRFDFGDCFYPSQAYPYVTSGRLILGCLVPFLVLYINGLDWLMAKLRLSFSLLGALLLIVALATYSEVVISIPVFQSAFNWFHMR